jgi:hypothetical protein
MAGGYFEWAPPSTCWRPQYWGEYRVFARRAALLDRRERRPATDGAILYPSTTVTAELTPTVSPADVFDAVEHPRADFANSSSDAMLRELRGRTTCRAPERGDSREI